MIRKLLSIAGAFACLALVSSDAAKADFGVFTYTTGVAAQNGATTPGAPVIGAGPVSVDIGNGNALSFSGSSSATGIDSTLPGGAAINFGSVTFVPGATDTVTNYTVSYNYSVAITDVMGGDTHTFNFTGMIMGTASGDSNPAINGTVLNFAVSPSSIIYNLGTYLAANNGGTGPGSSGGALTNGTLQGQIQTAAVPEPATLTLMGLGGFGLTLLRRRRAANA